MIGSTLGSVVCHSAFKISKKFRYGKCQSEQNDQNRPEMSHKEVGRVEFEQRAEANNRDQQLSDDHSFYSPNSDPSADDTAFLSQAKGLL